MMIESVLNMMENLSNYSGQLEKVEYFQLNDVDNFTVIIKLVFQKKTFFVLANKDDDSLELIQNTTQ
ncbi:hypothetical protein QUF54_05105, partial [Candidatus Marithioploca araucensis]|nr:hypothetical protein [Candidatus Marithioploca araucensis]